MWILSNGSKESEGNMIKYDYSAPYRQITYDTKEDYELVHSFTKQLQPVYNSIVKQTESWLPNLIISVSPEGELNLWVKSKRHEAIKLPQVYNVGQLLVHQVKFLLWVNREVDKIIAEPDKYFWCTKCSKVHPIDNLKDNVFSGYYCKDCYNNNPEVQRLIELSYEPGFYN